MTPDIKPTPLPVRETSALAEPSVRGAAAAMATLPLPEIDLRELLRLLWRRRWLMGGTVVIVMAAALVTLSQLTPRYTATAQVMIDPRQANVLDVEQVMSGLQANTETIQSEIEVLTSRNLAGRVIETTGLATQAEFNPAQAGGSGLFGWFGGKESEAPDAATLRQQRNRLIDNYLSALDVRAAGRSRVINIAFTAQSPDIAAQVANATAELYLVEQLEAKFEATRRATLWLSTRLDELRVKAEAAELAVSRFKSEMGKSGVEKASANRITQIGADILTISAKLEDARKRLVQLQMLKDRERTDLNDTSLSQSLQQLSIQIEDLEQDITDAGQELGPRHPRMVELGNKKADALTKYKVQLATEIQTLQSAIREDEQKLVSLQADQARLGSDVNDAGEAAVRLRTLERDAQATRTLYETVLTRFKETTEQQGLEQADARLISRADVPVEASFPDKKLFLLMALLAASGLGLVLAFAAEKIDSGFRSSDQIESMLGLPTIAMLPSLRSLGVKDVQPEIYVAQKPGSSFAEAVRMLRTSLMLSNVDQPPKVLMMASALPGEGKTTVALTLARLASLSGEKVVVLDADLRRPRVHAALGVENKLGLVELLSGQANIDQVLQSSEVEGKTVHYITAGQQTPHATELIRSQQMRRLVRSLAASFSLVIIDGPPVLPVADAKVIATLADKILYVVRWHDTRREVVAQAVRQLRDVGGSFAGIILNGVDVRRHAEYSYSDSGYYYGRYRNYYSD
jgi:polysaccharide biosynthesis transport protein